MPAAERDLTIEAGSHWRMRFTWVQPRTEDSDPLRPYDLSGCEVYMQLRQRYGSPVLLNLDSAASGGILLEPLVAMPDGQGGTEKLKFTGCIEVRMRPEQTEAIAARRGRYDLLVKFPAVNPDKPQDVEVYRILQGAFELSRVITIPVPIEPLLTAELTKLTTSPIPVVDLRWPRVPSSSYFDVLRDGVLIRSTRSISFRDVAPVGSHIYTLRAHNVFGQTTDSDPVPVEVVDPTVITLPSTGSGDTTTEPSTGGATGGSTGGTTAPVQTPVGTDASAGS